MKKTIFFLVLLAYIVGSKSVYAQCTPDIMGQNIIVNGDFEAGDVDFTTPLISWNDPLTKPPRTWSGPGEYYIHNDADDFNPGSFSSIPSPVSGGNMMMVDADCNPGETVWAQSVEVVANTNYYFSLWIASIHPDSPGQLAFEVNGVQLGTSVN